MDRLAAFPQAPLGIVGLFSCEAACGVRGGKSFGCSDNGGVFRLREWVLPLALREGDIGRLGCRDGDSRLARVGCALSPTAQSGRGGKGC